MIQNIATMEMIRQMQDRDERDYDVGAIVLRADDKSPARFHGGTWAKITNVFLLGGGGLFAK